MIEDLISNVEDWSIERGLHKADSNKHDLRTTFNSRIAYVWD